MLAGHLERVVTLVLTDIEGSTAAWESSAAEMAVRLEEHDRVVRDVVEAAGGVLVKSKGEGDSTFSVFDVAHTAVAAAVELQRRLPVPVRIAVHSGPVLERDGDYYGPTPNTAARVRATAHGRQVVVTDAAAILCRGRLDENIELRDLGTYRLRDLNGAVRLHQVVHPDLPTEFPPLRSIDGVGHRLPAPLTPLIGRDEARRAVTKALEQDRLVTLTGLGGIGKTRLALAAAQDQGGVFENGRWWIELAHVPSGGSVAEEIARHVEIPERGGETAVERIVGHMRRSSALLVLDNCEHLIDDAAAVVHEVLTACPALKVLATSREALELPGEIVVPVAPLDTGDAWSPAVQLLLDRCRTTMSAELAMDLCRRVDGIPLAIELVAAQVGVLGPEELAARLEQAVAQARRRGGPERHRSLRAALDGTYLLLPEGEQRFFRALSVFPAGFSLEAAGAVGRAEPLGPVSALVRASLVVVDETRFRMLAPVRQYGRALLEASGEADGAMSALLDWSCSRPRDENEAAAAALEWAVTEGRMGDAARLLVRRRPALLARSWTDGRRAVETIARDRLPQETLGALLALEAELCRRTGAVDEAAALADQALAVARAVGDTTTQANALATQVRLATLKGTEAEAEALGHQALAAARAAGDPHIEGTVLNYQGVLAATTGDLPAAVERWERSAELLRSTGETEALTSITCNLALAAYARRELGDAATLAVQALQVAQENGLDAPASYAIGLLGRIRQEEGHLDEAKRLLQEAIRMERLLQGVPHSTHARSALASILIESGDLVEAREVIADGLEVCRQHGQVSDKARYVAHLAALAAAERNLAEAGRLALEVVASDDRTPGMLALPLLVLAQANLDSDPGAAALLLGAVEAVGSEPYHQLERAQQERLNQLRPQLAGWEDRYAEGTRLSADQVRRLLVDDPPGT